MLRFGAMPDTNPATHKTETVTFKAAPHVVKALDACATLDGIDRSEFIRRAIDAECSRALEKHTRGLGLGIDFATGTLGG